nr:LamB/YcsF family protein [uncultured Blautia sp.]
MYSIDLNSDMGESFGAYKLGGDEEIIKYVTTEMLHMAGMQAIRW